MFFLFGLFSSFTVSLPPLAARGSRCLMRSATFVLLVLQPLLLQHHHPDTIVLVCFKHLVFSCMIALIVLRWHPPVSTARVSVLTNLRPSMTTPCPHRHGA